MVTSFEDAATALKAVTEWLEAEELSMTLYMFGDQHLVDEYSDRLEGCDDVGKRAMTEYMLKALVKHSGAEAVARAALNLADEPMQEAA